MSLTTLMIHSCDIVRKESSRGAGGGTVEVPRTRAAGVACRARPLKPEHVASLARDSIFATYKFYFVTNPQVDQRDYLKYIDPDGIELTLKVVSSYNPHDMDRFWKVYANTVRDDLG